MSLNASDFKVNSTNAVAALCVLVLCITGAVVASGEPTWVAAVLTGSALLAVSTSGLTKRIRSDLRSSGGPSWWVLALLFAISAVDWNGRFLLQSGGVRSLIVSCIVLTLFMTSRNSAAVSSMSRLAPALVGVFASAGLVTAAFFDLHDRPSYTLAVSFLAFLAPVSIADRAPSRRQRILLVIACTLFSVMHAVYLLAGRSEGLFKAFGQEQAPLLLVGLILVWNWARFLFPVVAVAACISVISYPALSYGMAVAAAVVVALMLRIGGRDSTRRRDLRLGIGLLLLTIVLGFQAPLSDISRGYVLADSNSNTRLELLDQGFDVFRSAPLLGKGFLETPTIDIVLSGERSRAPVHNDYLALAIEGGVIVVLALLYWFVVVNRLAMYTYGEARSGTARHSISLALVLFNAIWVLALVNPMIDKPSMVLFACLSWRVIMAHCRADRDAERRPYLALKGGIDAAELRRDGR